MSYKCVHVLFAKISYTGTERIINKHNKNKLKIENTLCFRWSLVVSKNRSSNKKIKFEGGLTNKSKQQVFSPLPQK